MAQPQNIEIVHVGEVLDFMRTGSSIPIVVKSLDGEKLLCKLKYGMSSSLALINEWLAGNIGSALKLPVLTPKVVNISPEMPIEHLHIEVGELIDKSRGLNIAFPFLEDLQSYPIERILHSAETDRLFLLDLFLLNVDRTPKNPNVLYQQVQFYTIDYESCLLFRNCLHPFRYESNPSILKALRENPFYRPVITQSDFDDFFLALSQIDFTKMVDSIPRDWLLHYSKHPEHTRTNLIQGLHSAIRKKDDYFDIFNSLARFSPESQEERTHRIRKNRERFEIGLKDHSQ